MGLLSKSAYIVSTKPSERDADFFPTCPTFTTALLENVSFEGSIIEPCCGDGAMAAVISQQGYKVIASDKTDYGYGELADAFTLTGKHDNIVTNPPYNLAQDMVEHFLSITTGKVAVLLNASWIATAGRTALLNHYPPETIIVMPWRMKYLKDDGTMGTSGFSHYWIVWDNSRTTKDTKMIWATRNPNVPPHDLRV